MNIQIPNTKHMEKAKVKCALSKLWITNQNGLGPWKQIRITKKKDE